MQDRELCAVQIGIDGSLRIEIHFGRDALHSFRDPFFLFSRARGTLASRCLGGSQASLRLCQAIFGLLPVWPDFQGKLVVRYRRRVLALVQVGVGQVQVRIRHAWVQTSCLMVCLDRQVQ